MYKRKFTACILILILFVSSAGCATLQRKFARKEKEEERIAPVITTYDYSKELRVDELYRKHFLFWQSWQTELINRLDATLKKRTTCYDYIISSLMEMRKYLIGPKVEELDSFIVEVKSIETDIKDKKLSKSSQYRIKRILERTKRQIDRKFSYPNVKGSLELKK